MQIPTPLQATTTIPWGEDSFTVTFRQSVGVDDDRLVAYEREVKRGHWVESADGARHYESEVWEPEKLYAEQVRLLLVGCDLEKHNGKPLFVSGMDRKAFAEAWGLIPSDIRNKIHEACIEVNPDLDPFWYTRGAKPSESTSEESLEETEASQETS